MDTSRQVLETAARAREGYINAEQATAMVADLGGLMIGTAQHAEGYTPRLLLTSLPLREDIPRSWEVKRVNEHIGVAPAVRAGSIGELAIWSAFGGDPNHALQRQAIGKSFLPDDKRYQFGTYGWKWQDGKYALRAHRDLLLGVRDIDDATVVGDIDIIARDNPEELFELASEPGQYGLLGAAETVASMPVRMGDVRSLGGITSFYFEPTQL